MQFDIASRFDEAKDEVCPNCHDGFQNHIKVSELLWVCSECRVCFMPKAKLVDIKPQIKSILEQQMRDRVEGRYKCDICGELFTTPIAKAQHVRKTGHKKEKIE